MTALSASCCQLMRSRTLHACVARCCVTPALRFLESTLSPHLEMALQTSPSTIGFVFIIPSITYRYNKQHYHSNTNNLCYVIPSGAICSNYAHALVASRYLLMNAVQVLPCKRTVLSSNATITTASARTNKQFTAISAYLQVCTLHQLLLAQHSSQSLLLLLLPHCTHDACHNASAA
jgi:hypothetical protein